MTSRTVALVVAKAPVPGKAKTRLSPPASPEQAADIAAASLLDTLDAVRATPQVETVVAWTGEITSARRSDDVAAALSETILIGQRGTGLNTRLAAAHADAGRALPALPVFQIGMDTPQVTPHLLTSGIAALHRPGGPDAVLGPASDGGWWALGVREPRFAEVLRTVPMSQPDTGERTLRALRHAGLRVEPLVELSDVDNAEDAWKVAASVPGSRFAAAVRSMPGQREPKP